MKHSREATRAVAIPAPRPAETGLWLFLAAAGLVALSFAVAGAFR